MAQDRTLDPTETERCTPRLDDSRAAGAPEGSLGRLAAELVDRGVETPLTVQPSGARRTEVLRVSLNGRSVLVWESGPSFLTGCWQVIGSTSKPEETADRIIAGLAGDGR